MKDQPRKLVTHFQNSNFKHKMKRLQLPQKLEHEKFYVHEVATINFFFSINVIVQHSKLKSHNHQAPKF